MKTKLLIPLLAGCGLCLLQLAASAQEFKEHLSKQFTLQKPANITFVGIYNLFGSIKVEGYAGDKVIIEIDKTISGETSADVEAGKKDFKMGFSQTADSILAYIDEPYDTKPHNGWYHRDRDNDNHYKIKLEFTVKVPYNVSLRANTVNDGDIAITDVYGNLRVNNVNGAIDIKGAKGTTNVRTVNGDLNVTYLSVPTESSSYYTLNGKLTVTYPASFSGDLQFKSMNGGFFTDFPNAEILPAQVVKTEEKKANGTTYKLNKNTQIRIGGGGKLFRYETLNGNIYIKKQS